MKKFIYTIIALLGILMPNTAWAEEVAAEPYAVLNEDSTILTFYYDNQKVARKGMDVGPFRTITLRDVFYEERDNEGEEAEDDEEETYATVIYDVSGRGWNESITTVVFDSSFSSCTTLTSTAYWFVSCKNLTTITGIQNLNTSNVTDMKCMFAYCSSLTSLDLSSFKTDNVSNISEMFLGCFRLTNLDVTNFKTDNVTNMSGIFEGCSGLKNLDVSNFKTDNVTDMSEMFADCSSLTKLDVTNFKTDNVTSMGHMFYGCSSLTNLDVSNFKTDNVTSMSGMFYGCSSLTNFDVSNFKTDNVKEMNGMFSGCSSLTSLDVSNFKTDNVTYMTSMFSFCSSLISLDVTNFKTDNVINMSYMFWACSGLTKLDVTNFKTDNVTSMSGMFDGCSGLTALDVSKFNTDNVTNMSYMFSGCSGLTNLDVTNFKTGNVSSMSDMFSSCSGLTSLDLSKFNTDNVTSMSGMFSSCSGLTSLDLSKFKTDNVTDMSSMFYNCSGLTSLDLSNFKTDNVTNMTNMFSYCSGLTSLDLSNFKTDNVTNMAWLFYKCSKLESIEISKFKTGKVTDMTWMFTDCSSLTSLDLSNFNTENVTDMTRMFDDCSSLTSLDLSSFNTENVTNMYGMFYDCDALASLDLSNFKTNNVTDMKYMFGFCLNLKTIYASNSWNTSKVVEGSDVFSYCFNLIGGNGTKYDGDHADYSYARIDRDGEPGYFTDIADKGKEKAEVEAYVVLSADSTVQTFYYDDQKEVRNGTNLRPFEREKRVPWVTTVVFDNSFANCSTITSTAGWFAAYSNLTSIIGIENLKTDNVTDMNDMFGGCSSLTSLDVSTFNTENVEDMSYMFSRCDGLKSLDLSNFNAPKVTNLTKMFDECKNLESLNLSGFKTESVTDMYDMFGGCSSLTVLDLSGFNTSHMPYISCAFLGCSKLTTIYVGAGWSTYIKEQEGKYDDPSGGDNVFDECVNLVGGNGTTYDAEHTDYTYARIDKDGEPGYFTLAESSEKKEQVATPTWAFQNEMLALSTETADASIYYATANWENEAETDSIANTIDVSTRSTLYQDPLEITDNIIIKMIAAKEGMENSEVATFIYDYKSWKELYETVRAGEDLLSKAQDSGKVDEGLIEELKWALNEGDMMYQRRAEMSNQEAKYFTDAIVNICIKIKEQMGATSELKQDEEEFYLIGTAADWKAFAELALVNPKANARMTADIDLEDDQTMIGSVDDPSKYYQGIFDGEAHTLNVNYLAGSFVAPFRYVMGATIQRLHVIGRMEANETCCVGGIVASVKASEENLSTIIRSCWSSALLVATTSGSKQNTIGGIVAEDNGRVIIEDCLFDGKFGKDNTTYNGGFIANVWGTAVIRNGLNVGEYSTNTEYRSGTFYRPDEERDPVTLENAYYLNACGTAQGTQATEEELANGEILKKLQNSRTANVWKQGEAYPILTMIPYQAYMPEFSFRDDYIEISSKSEGAKIYYAIQEFDNNWSTDTIAHIATNLEVLVDSTEYEIPIEAREDLIIKAIAVKKGMKNSEEAVYIYPYTEWLKMVDTINELTARLNDAMTDYTPSPEVQSMIDRFKTQVAYIYDIYYYERTEWDRERVIDERDRLQALYYELEVKIKADQSEDIIATYGNRIMYVMGQTTMAHALEQVGGREEVTKDIAAIVWNSTEALTRSDLEGFNNPNMLIYVQTDSLAPEGVNNVIIDGKAKSITLVDAEGNNNFFAPQEFTVESISYTREFKQTTQKDISRGWEGISLPFTVQKFTHESHGEIAPFGNDASIFHFWLHLMTDKGLINATTIEACKPYIISMPNNGSYPEAYNQAGKVTFSAENTTVPASVYEQIWTADGSVSMLPTFYNVEADEYTYALNVGREIEGYVEGSVFVKNYRTIRPFEVYTFHEPSRNEGAGARFISVSSLFGGEGTTGIIDVIQPADNDNVKVYSLNGTLLKQGKRHEVMNTLPKGVYIINNKKMVVK